jgi:hypothetical protein
MFKLMVSNVAINSITAAPASGQFLPLAKGSFPASHLTDPAREATAMGSAEGRRTEAGTRR